MADLVNIVDGNFTSAATWGLVDPTSKNVSTSQAQSTLLTSDLSSTAFTPGAITVAGVVIKLTARSAGTPTNTITVTLRDTTAGTDVAVVTANVSSLPVSFVGADSEGGWHYFKFAAPVLLAAGNTHTIRIKLSATTTVVSIGTNGTAFNWQRLLVTTTTQAPAAGDDLFMAQTLDGATNPATVVARSVTMDSVAATDYGSAVVSTYQPAISVSKSCTFAYGIAAATNYILRLSGTLIVYSGGIFRIGSSGAEIPRDSTAVLEFDNAADSQFGLRVLNLATFNAFGLSRTSGKNEWMALLSADEAIASTTIDVDTDTGWLDTDEVLITSTSRTSGQNEVRTLSGNAGATSFAITAGLTNAHLGSGDYFGEVFLLTRNVEIRSTSSTFMMFFTCTATSTTSLSWMRWRYYCAITIIFTIGTTTGSFTAQYCVWRDSEQGMICSTSTGGWSFDKCLIYANASVGTTFTVGTTSLPNWSLTDFAMVGGPTAINLNSVNGTIGNLWICDYSNGIIWNAPGKLNDGSGGPTLPANTVWTMHSLTGGATFSCLAFNDTVTDIVFPRFNFWRNNVGGPFQLDLGHSMSNVEFTGDFFGNGVAATEEPGGFIAVRQNGMADVRFVNCNISGDDTYQANWGHLFDGYNIFASEIQWTNCKFSENTGTRRPFLVADIGVIPDINSGGMLLQGIAEDCTFGAPETVKWYLATGPAPRLASKYSYILCPRYNQTAGLHRTYTPYGTFIIDTTIFDVTPSQNIQPIAGAAIGVDSNAFRRNTGFVVAVNSGGTVTPSVKVQIDGTYNGSTMPELVMLANRALGFNSDVVLDTHNGTPSVFDTLTGTTGVAAADGVLEFVVRCYGTLGNAWVDTWSTSAAGQDTTGERYWWGQPITNPNTTGGGGGGGAIPSSAAYIG